MCSLLYSILNYWYLWMDILVLIPLYEKVNCLDLSFVLVPKKVDKCKFLCTLSSSYAHPSTSWNKYIFPSLYRAERI